MQVRPEASPTFGSVRVQESMLGRVIGSGGSTIRELEERFEARVDVGDNGGWDIWAGLGSRWRLAGLMDDCSDCAGGPAGTTW